MQNTVRFATLATTLLMLGATAASAAPPCPTADSCVEIRGGTFFFDETFEPISYKITGSLRVAATATLSIPPGTKLYFDRGVDFQVNGRLLVGGTEAEPVLMTSLAATPAPGDWRGIAFTNSVGNVIENAEISNASDPIVGRGSSVSVVSSTLDVPEGLHSGIELDQVPPGSRIRIVDTVITGGYSANGGLRSKAGIRISQSAPPPAPDQAPELSGEILLNDVRGFSNGIYTSGLSPTIELNIVMDNQDGIVADTYKEISGGRITSRAFGSPEIARNVVTSNARTGIATEGGRPRIEGNTVTENGRIGISVSGGSALVLRNTIVANTHYGVFLDEEPFFVGRENPRPVLTGNDLYGNDRISITALDLFNDIPASSLERVDARANYWKVENPVTIKRRIHDGDRRFGQPNTPFYGIVDICPYVGHDGELIDDC